MSGNLKINTVTILGASGSMGVNVSAIFASFGNAKVYMLSRTKNEKSVSKAIKSIRCESIKSRLILADYSELEKCISESDLVFDSTIEDISIKMDINSKVIKYLKKDAIYVTGTSGLAITKMAEAMPENIRERYFGMHFFNPPYSVTLCELIKTKFTNEKLFTEIQEYLTNVLNRTVVIVKDAPAFLANRIGFHFINKAIQYADQYKDEGGIDYIESILGVFTGRAMSPCMTADFVGLDVHKAIMDNLLNNTNDYANALFTTPEYINKLISNNKLGKKIGEGLFKQVCYEDGTKKTLVYDIKTDSYREKRKFYFDFATKMNAYIKNGDYKLAFDELLNNNSKEALICKEFLKEYVDYSLYVANEVCDELSYVDDAMATGFNWCPPLVMSNLLFGTNYKTKYDFRSYFKAGK